MAYLTGYSIADFVQDIYHNKYVLPSIQREFVWKAEQIVTLFDSLMQDYPIGTFLFWEIRESRISEYTFYEFLKKYHEADESHNKRLDLKGVREVVAVLDGQQRLTSLYLGLKGSIANKLKHRRRNCEDAYPEKKLYLNLLSASEESDKLYDFKFLTVEESENDAEKYWFEVGKALDFKDIAEASNYVNKNINTKNYTQDKKDFAIGTLPKLWYILNRQDTISFVKEKSEELDKVLNIFIRVNSGGTKLSYSDLLLSIASAQWSKKDARQEILELVKYVNGIDNGFEIDKDFVLKTALVLCDFPNIAFKVDNFKKENMEIIEANWDTIKEAIVLAVRLVSSFGYSKYTLSSNYALIPIAYYIFLNNIQSTILTPTANNKSDRNKIRKWLIRSLLKKVFSGQPDSVLNPIRHIIQINKGKEFPFESIMDKFRGGTKTIVFTEDDVDSLLGLKFDKADTLSTLMLLYPSLDYSNIFHKDHMYPKSKFKESILLEKGVAKDDIWEYIECVDTLPNIQLLEAQLNEEKYTSDFDVWFKTTMKNEEDRKEYMRKHYLPKIEYSYANFLEFIEKRRALLKEQLCNILVEKHNPF